MSDRTTRGESAFDEQPGFFDGQARQIEQLDAAARLEVLSAYLDDELSPGAARHVTAWLEANPRMLGQVERDRRIGDLLDRSYEDEPVPEGFSARVLEATVKPMGRVLRIPLPALAAAAVLLVALGAFLYAAVIGVGSSASERPGVETEAAALPGDVPVEYLEEADLLLSLSDEAFQAYLVTDPDQVALTDAEEGG